jgi:hypothetical protein
MVGIAAAVQLTFLLGQSRQLAEERRALLLRLARFDGLLADLTTAQAAYVAPGQADAPWVERVSALSNTLGTEFATLRSDVRAPESAAKLQTISDALSNLSAADATARDHLAQEQDLLAADVIFAESLNAVNAARASTGSIVTAENVVADAEEASLQQRAALVAGGVAAIWLVGLLLLVPRTGRPAETTGTGLAEITRVPAPERAEAPAMPSVDLAATADLCTALSRVVSSAALPDMLARAAALVDASGIIVWMGSGNELYAVMSHGYDPRSIRRLGAILRDADNATAEAWRTGELRTVAGDMVSNGAIVAPMFGPESCVGVVAAELRNGREQDPATQAVTVMIAAQLALVVGAWPAAPPVHAAEA